MKKIITCIALGLLAISSFAQPSVYKQYNFEPTGAIVIPCTKGAEPQCGNLEVTSDGGILKKLYIPIGLFEIRETSPGYNDVFINSGDALLKADYVGICTDPTKINGCTGKIFPYKSGKSAYGTILCTSVIGTKVSDFRVDRTGLYFNEERVTSITLFIQKGPKNREISVADSINTALRKNAKFEAVMSARYDQLSAIQKDGSTSSYNKSLASRLTNEIAEGLQSRIDAYSLLVRHPDVAEFDMEKAKMMIAENKRAKQALLANQ